MAKQPEASGVALSWRGVLVALALVAVVGGLALVGRSALFRGAAEPTIGGPFTLVNAQGQTVSDSAYRGRWMLVYFGYTFCPDVCPTELGTVADALGHLSKGKAAKIAPLFISIDPARDTPAKMGAYVQAFGAGIEGLTGSPEQIGAAAKAYRVYYQKVDAPAAHPDDYTMDHTSIVYLMDPQGRFAAHYDHDTTSAQMVADLEQRVD